MTGKDAAAKMAILARLAFNAAVRLDQVRYEGIERLTADDIAYAKELGLSLKLVGLRRAHRRRHRRRTCYPAFLYARPPAGLGQRRVQRGHDRVAGDHRDHAVRPGRGRDPDGQRRAGRRDLGDDPAALARAAGGGHRRCVTDTESAFYLHLEVADRPGVLAQVAEILGLQGVSVKSVVQKGLGDDARLVMVMHPVLESKFRAAVDLIARLDFVREPRG